MIRRGSAQKYHAARRAWLLANAAKMASVPGANEDVTDAGRIRLTALHLEMAQLGLFGAGTSSYQLDTLRRLVSELRGEHIGDGRW